MKKLHPLVLFACVSVGLVVANAQRTLFKTPFNDPSDLAAVKQIEQEMGDAMVAVDIDRLSRIYADDFADVGSDGKVTTKKNLLTDFRSFHDKLESYELGPVDVQVLGNAAVAHGTVTETRKDRDGKDTSGTFVWMDLLKKRSGKWAVVRSAGAKVN